MADERDETTLPPDSYEREETTDLKDSTPDPPKGVALHTRILLGLLIGAAAGLIVHSQAGGDNTKVIWFISNITEPIGHLFLRLLLMIVVPLVFSSLVVGVAGIGDIRKLGRVGLKTFAYTVVISAISVAIGLMLANTVRPGKRIDASTAEALKARYGSEANKRVEDAQKTTGPSESGLMQVVKKIVPQNPIAAISGLKPDPATGLIKDDNPDMLHVMFFSLLL